MEEYLSDKEQWEQVKAWVRENGLWIVAGIVVGAGALGGWRWYQDHTDAVGTQASSKYAQILEAFGRNDRTQGFVLLGELEHLIRAPREFYVDEEPLGITSLQIIDAEGVRQIVTLRDPLMLPGSTAS